MVGKVKVTSTGYDPDGPRVFDPTLAVNEEKGSVGVSEERTLTPVGRRLIIAPEDREEYGNLAVPKGALAKELRFCVVLAVGPKVKDTHPQLKPGVAVWLKPYFGTEVVVNGNLVLFCKPEDVVGKVAIESNK